MAFSKICKITDVPSSDSREFRLLEQDILVINTNRQFHCLSAKCPHAGAPLAHGIVRGEELQCPWHGNLFKVTDGTPVYKGMWTEEPLKVYPCEVRGDELFVDL